MADKHRSALQASTLFGLTRLGVLPVCWAAVISSSPREIIEPNRVVERLTHDIKRSIRMRQVLRVASVVHLEFLFGSRHSELHAPFPLPCGRRCGSGKPTSQGCQPEAEMCHRPSLEE